ncbi:MAG: efflux RND transporter permease subunit [Mucinivorans sp.]
MNRPFRVILIMVTLMVVGVAMLPLLSVQYMPSQQQGGITVSYSWPEASAKVMEAEVTSKIEGVLAPISGVASMQSGSSKDQGYVSLTLKKGGNIDAIRFEVSSRLRSLYSTLPAGVSYPSLSTGVRGDSPTPILSYTLNADLSTWEIGQYAEKTMVPKLSKIEGVENVYLSGATPFEWVVEFDAERCAMLGIKSSDISTAFSLSGKIEPLGIATADDGTPITVNFLTPQQTPDNWNQIEIYNIDGRIITLGDVATISRRQQLPTYYNRINGLNNVNLTVYASPGVNNLTLATAVKEAITELPLPSGYSITLVDDTTEYIKKELDKIYSRTGLSILILLLFVFLTSRSWRYLLMIVVTLAANILIALIFYNLLGIEIHLYSLAGITVSLGMIIDTSIIMLDHYSRFHNRRVFLAILAALLTTIGALSIVYFLPEEQRANLVAFSIVIIINLVVSMFISLLFVPALLDSFPLKIGRRRRFSTRSKRRIIRITRLYSRFISFGRRHRLVFIVVAILSFGLPVHMLPTEIGEKNALDSTLTLFQRTYNATLGAPLYQNTLKNYVEPALGGSLRLFAKDIFSSFEATDPERTKIYINASLPPGCDIHQLNATVAEMENFLSQFSEIDIFRTSISSVENGQIVVTFTPEAEKAGFAFRLKDLATTKAISLGGADWSVWGVGQGFSNKLGNGWKSNAITLTGYNYDALYALASELTDSISVSPRVKEPVVASSRWDFRTKTEFFLRFNLDRFALYKLAPSDYFASLGTRLYDSRIGNYYDGLTSESVVLSSSAKDGFDAWHLSNDMLRIGDRDIKLSELGKISKETSDNDIYKTNQQYSLTVGFDFIGSWELGQRFEKRHVERLEKSLPIGYKVAGSGSGWWWGDKEGLPYALLALIVAIIFTICAVLFESLRQPLVIISMIPISFVGVFLTFSLFNLPFDQGGFASFVLLSGLVVNAGIYLVNEYNVMRQMGATPGLRTYLRAYNRKIIPILLTVISTVLGLLPFVMISREPFWFSFAAGAIGGMIFSIVAVTAFLPLLLPMKK